MLDGLYRAILMLRSERRSDRTRSGIVVVSDGQDVGSSRSPAEVIDLANATETHPRALFYTIGFTNSGSGGLSTLREIATKTGGAFWPASSSMYFPSLVESARDHIYGAYRLTYPAQLDGGTHAVAVAVEGVADERRVRFEGGPNGPRWWMIVGGAVGFVVISLGLTRLGPKARAKLVFVDSEWKGRTARLQSGVNRIGSLPDNEVVIDRETVSKHHAEIRVHRKGAEIVDLGSTNKTWVNGIIETRSSLSQGDRLRIADVELEFRQ